MPPRFLPNLSQSQLNHPVFLDWIFKLSDGFIWMLATGYLFFDAWWRDNDTRVNYTWDTLRRKGSVIWFSQAAQWQTGHFWFHRTTRRFGSSIPKLTSLFLFLGSVLWIFSEIENIGQFLWFRVLVTNRLGWQYTHRGQHFFVSSFVELQFFLVFSRIFSRYMAKLGSMRPCMWFKYWNISR